MIPYGSKIIKARIYEEDDNAPNKTLARQEAKKEIKKEVEDETREKE